LVLVACAIKPVREHSVEAYLFLAPLAIATISVFANLFLRRNYLDITAGGLVAPTFFGPRSISWDEVQSFGAVDFFGMRFVGFDYAPSYRKYSAVRRLNKLLIGVEGALLDYGMKVDELVALLNEIREQHVAVERNRA
jgi:hypothetical protein